MNPRSNLVLIGMPGSGKSTLGVLAAKALGLSFLDTDLVLQAQAGMRLAEILQKDGSGAFLKREDRLLCGLYQERTVISTGGSAVYHAQGMAHLKSYGTVIWVDVPLAELQRRLGDMVSRGVVLAPGQTLSQLYEERRPLYQRWAELHLRVGLEPLEITVTRLIDLVNGS